MKKYVISLIFLLILSVFSGCDYYDDVDISIKLTEPDSLGIVEYNAGVSTKENAARLNLLRYELDAIDDGQIKITFPEKIKDDSGTEFAIDSFGGAIGPNAPLQKFDLIINVQEKANTDNPITLTIDAGSLPLNTSNWNDIQISYLADDTVTVIPLEEVVFIGDEPFVYSLYLKEKDKSGSTSDATDSDKWYEIPETQCTGGEKVIVKVKQPGDNTKRSLNMGNKPLEPVTVKSEYAQYEFIMPYHNVTLTIVDKQN